jgi:hypothetical protein
MANISGVRQDALEKNEHGRVVIEKEHLGHDIYGQRQRRQVAGAGRCKRI